MATRKALMPGKVSPRLSVPPHIQCPPYANTGRVPDFSDKPEVHDEEVSPLKPTQNSLLVNKLNEVIALVDVAWGY